jgi:hypothetical protein
MLQIDNTIISRDIIENKFSCDLIKCKGACCLYGDSGAPLDLEETFILKKIYPQIKKYLTVEGLLTIEAFGLFIEDEEGDLVTPLINNKECAYSYTDDKKILKCAIEKAFLDKKIKFRKPVSCHLYSIRINKHKDFDAVNYHKWSCCEHAVIQGNNKKISLYQFLKIPLIRKYGKEWYSKLDYAAKNYYKKNSKKIS